MPAQSQPSLSLANGHGGHTAANPARQVNTAAETTVADSAVSDGLEKVHDEFKKLFAGARPLNARSAVYNILAAHHPDHFIVSIHPYQFDLLEFADAGYASIEINQQGNHFDIGRRGKPAYGGRLYGKQAQVTNKVYWAQSTYTWQCHQYLLYQASWKIIYDQEVKWCFLLHPRGPGQQFGHQCREIDDLLLAIEHFNQLPHEDIFVFEDQWVSRDKDMYEAIKASNWDDVIIDPATKEAIKQDIVSFFEPATMELYKRYSIPYKRGIILHGSPGNGKTITIKALINHLQSLPTPIPTLYAKSTTDKCKGDQESLKRLFKAARSRAPVLLVLEDLDSLVKSDIRSHFLNEIDGLQSMDGILILASTNHLNSIDSAISSRPSRFDRKYAFELPDRASRERYAQHWRAKLADNADVEFPEEVCGLVADLTAGFSFAYLKELFVSTLLILSRGAAQFDAAEDGAGAQQDFNTLGDGEQAGSAVISAQAKKVGEKNAESAGSHDDKVDKAERQLLRVPRIDVPSSLHDNVLLKTLQRQIALLVKDMNDAAVKKSADDAKVAETDKPKKDKSESKDDHSCSKC